MKDEELSEIAMELIKTIKNNITIDGPFERVFRLR
jgi:hypothetical protein